MTVCFRLAIRMVGWWWGVVPRMHPSKQKLVIYNENSFLSLTWAPAPFDSRLDDGVGEDGVMRPIRVCHSHNRKVSYNIRNNFSYLPRGPAACRLFKRATAASSAVVVRKEKLVTKKSIVVDRRVWWIHRAV